MDSPSGVIGVEHVEVQRVATVDSATGQIAQVTPANLHIYEYDWSPDSTKLAYIAATPPGEDNWWTAKLYAESLVNASTYSGSIRSNSIIGQTPNILFDPTTTTGPLHGLQIAVPRFSPDGQTDRLHRRPHVRFRLNRRRHLDIPTQAATPKNLTPRTAMSTPTWIRWMSPKEILFTELDQGDAAIHMLECCQPISVDPKPMFREAEASATADAEASISVANNGEVAFTRSGFTLPPEVWAGPARPSGADHPPQRRTQVQPGARPNPRRGPTKASTCRAGSFTRLDYDPAQKISAHRQRARRPVARRHPALARRNFGAAAVLQRSATSSSCPIRAAASARAKPSPRPTARTSAMATCATSSPA